MSGQRNWRKWTRVGLATGTVVLGVSVYVAQDWARHQLPGYLTARLTQAMGRPVSVGQVSFWPPGVFTLRNLRVEQQDGEKAPPLVAPSVQAHVSWWNLLIHRRLLVTGLDVIHPHLALTVDLRKPATTQANPTSQLLSFYGVGLRRVAVHKGDADVTTILKTGEVQPVAARGLDFEVKLRPASLDYTVRADHWNGAGLEATRLLAQGRADGKSITVRRSRAEFRGGTLVANGTYVTEGSDVAMQVRVRDLPVGNLAPQLGIPKEWGVEGKLTGTVDVSARTGALQRAHGTVSVSPGAVAHSHATFPWNRASAEVDWKPEGAALRNINVQGDGIRLVGSADVGGTADQEFMKRPYRAEGTVEATKPEAVQSLAEVLAFGTPIRNRLAVGGATAAFHASGIVGNLAASRAQGHLSAHDVMVRPTTKSPALLVRSIEGDLDRYPTYLKVNNLKAAAEGVSGGGTLTVTPRRPGHPGTYQFAGQMDLTNLVTLQQQLAGAPYWQWLDPAGPTSRGRLTVQLTGSTTDPERVSGSGGFRLQNFGASLPTGKDNARWHAPIRELTGRLRVQNDQLALSEVRLRSDLFNASADGVIRDLSDKQEVTGSARLVSPRWQELPPLRGRIPAGLTGGTLALLLQAPEKPPLVAGASQAPRALNGTVVLAGAAYRATAGGRVRNVAIQASDARFHYDGEKVTVSAYRLVTPEFRTSGSGVAMPETAVVRTAAGKPGSAWRVRANGRLDATDAGELARWWSGQNTLQGGRLSATYAVDAPMSAPAGAVVTSRFRLTDAQPVLPAGTLPFAAGEAKIRSLTGLVRLQDGDVRFSNAVWQSPAFRVTGNGTVSRNILDATVKLATPEWRRLAGDLARTLPVTGGELVVSGSLRGPVDKLRAAPIQGSVALRGARLVAMSAGLPVEGKLDAKADTHGTLERLVNSDVDGSFSITQLLLPPVRKNVARLRVDVARGEFHRVGTRIDLTNLKAEARGARLTGQGTLTGLGTKTSAHSFELAAEGPALAALLPAVAPIPGKAQGGKFTASLTVRGTGASPWSTAEGRAEVQGGRWTPPGQTTALLITGMTTHFTRKGSVATLDPTVLRVQGGEATLQGSATGLDTAQGARHDLSVNWKLEDASAWASRFFPIPGWFTGGTFTGEARMKGSASAVAQTATGRFEIRDAGFLPPQPILGGPAQPVAVHWAKGLFNRENGKLTLRELDLNSSIGTATGRAVADDRGIADIRGRAEVTRLQELVNLWPGFAGRIRGGSAQMTLRLHGPLRQPNAFSGVVDLKAAGGELTVAEVDPLYSTHPFEELSGHIVLTGAGGPVRLEKLRMRGPKASLDGTGLVAVNGKVSVKGKAWFSSRYTKQIVKPKILYPVAVIAGLGRIKSSFEVNGSLREARLSLGITKSLAWKVAIKDRVPPPLRLIALGQTPLWSGDPAPQTRVAIK